MTIVRRAARPLVVGVAVAMLIAVFPVHPVVAVEAAPETRAEPLGELEAADEPPAQAGAEDDDAPAAGEDAGDEQAGVDDGWQTSKIAEAPIPFTMLGFSAPDGAEVLVRTAADDGEWSRWYELEPIDVQDGPDPGSAEERDAAKERDPGRWTSEPLWVSEARYAQFSVHGADLADIEVEVIDTMGLSETLFQRVSRQLARQAQPAAAEAATYPVKTRKDWGADESWRKGDPSYATVRFAVLHHTGVSSHNEYDRSEVPGIIRGMYRYHTQSLGWKDIGYNFIVDRYGTVWEGRHGGIERGVVGAHAAGFNTGSFGVALLGNFETAQPTSAAVKAATELMAWKYHVHDIDPNPARLVRHNSRWINTLSGHRDVGNTLCPGRYLYDQLDDIRYGISVAISKFGSPLTPVTGDWNRDGRTTIGWFRDGEWWLRNSNSSGDPHLEFTFGRAGDIPVVGDWNGDGRTTVGVVRNGRWLLRNANSGGGADYDFWYGRAQDYPIPGDWNGDGRDTPGIVRDGEWHLRNSLSGGRGQIVFTYGRVTRGDIPVVGDWNRNGRDTPGILRDGDWHLRNSLSGGAGEIVFTYGRVTRGDVPVVGDWDRNGRTTIGVTRGGAWHLRNSLSGGPANVTFTYQ
jgi:hypothetical protein